MIARLTSLVTLVVLLVCSMQVRAISDEQYQVIRKMGELNGVALHCRFFDETRRMKAALISSLPKRRQLGQAFDEFTNESFLALIQQQAVCPAAGDFSKQVDEAIIILDAAFSGK